MGTRTDVLKDILGRAEKFDPDKTPIMKTDPLPPEVLDANAKDKARYMESRRRLEDMPERRVVDIDPEIERRKALDPARKVSADADIDRSIMKNVERQSNNVRNIDELKRAKVNRALKQASKAGDNITSMRGSILKNILKNPKALLSLGAGMLDGFMPEDKKIFSPGSLNDNPDAPSDEYRPEEVQKQIEDFKRQEALRKLASKRGE